MYTLVNDLESRAAGFDPGSDDGRIWPHAGYDPQRGARPLDQLHVDVVAGGRLPSGQVIGSTDSRGLRHQGPPVRPADLAATVFSIWISTWSPNGSIRRAGRFRSSPKAAGPFRS